MRKKNGRLDSVLWITPKLGMKLEPVSGFGGCRLSIGCGGSREARFEVEEVDSAEFEYADCFSSFDENEASFSWLVFPVEAACELEGLTIKESKGIRALNLMAYRSLQREFSSLGENERQIQQFASKYGFLGTQIMLMATDDDRLAWAECT